MFNKILVLEAAIVLTAISMGGLVLPNNQVFADNIICGTTPCNGTVKDDNMIGNNQANAMICGRNGNDKIDLKDAPANSIEAAGGGFGNDYVKGGTGRDEIAGDDFFSTGSNGVFCVSQSSQNAPKEGADRIDGGPNNDLIFHGTRSVTPANLESDGHKDFIDCGPGIDSATINTSVDGDVAINCENINAG